MNEHKLPFIQVSDNDFEPIIELWSDSIDKEIQSVTVSFEIRSWRFLKILSKCSPTSLMMSRASSACIRLKINVKRIGTVSSGTVGNLLTTFKRISAASLMGRLKSPRTSKMAAVSELFVSFSISQRTNATRTFSLSPTTLGKHDMISFFIADEDVFRRSNSVSTDIHCMLGNIREEIKIKK